MHFRDDYIMNNNRLLYDYFTLNTQETKSIELNYERYSTLFIYHDLMVENTKCLAFSFKNISHQYEPLYKILEKC